MVSEIKAEITYLLKIWPGIMAVAALLLSCPVLTTAKKVMTVCGKPIALPVRYKSNWKQNTNGGRAPVTVWAAAVEAAWIVPGL